MTCRHIIDALDALANPANVAGMARYGINPVGTLGVSMPLLRKIAKEIGRCHHLADEPGGGAAVSYKSLKNRLTR